MKLTGFGGGSDYLWFLRYGIPAGGLHTGAGGSKSYEEKDVFGGVALVAHDVCYHRSCDNINNIDTYALSINLLAASSVVEKFAIDLPSELANRKSTNINFPVDSPKVDKFLKE